MADIELVIRIPEELLEYFANHNCMSEDGWFSHSNRLLDAFRNGIPLPKGHGGLIDVNALLEKQYRIDDSATLSTRDVVNVEDIEDAQTIIEADKTEVRT